MSALKHAELDALQGLLESEGWRLWLEWYDKEWGAVAFAQKVAKAIGTSNVDPAKAVTILQQITVAHEAVQGLKEWPAHRMQQLKQQFIPTEPNMSRRGPGL